MTPTEVLKCPACDAPLEGTAERVVVVCSYCGAEVRLDKEARQAERVGTAGAPGRRKIGRSGACDIVVDHPSVNRIHASVEERGPGRYLIEDLGSSSGTKIRGLLSWKNITSKEVAGDMRIRLGDFETTVNELLQLAR